MSTAVNRAQEERHRIYKRLLLQQVYLRTTDNRTFEKALLEVPSRPKAMPLQQPVSFETPIKEPVSQSRESVPKPLLQSPAQAHQVLPKSQIGIQHQRYIKLKTTSNQGPYLPSNTRIEEYVPILFEQTQRRQEQPPQHEQESSQDAFWAEAAKLARLEQAYVQCAQLLVQSEISELVESMHLGIDQQGLCQFTLELKSPELCGVCVEVSCANRLVNLKFKHTNSTQAALVRSNIQILRDKLAHKKLGLATASVI